MNELWSSSLLIAALAVPATFALAGVASPRRATLASGAASSLALFFALGTSLVDAGAASLVRFDVPTRVMLVLVTALGAVVARFSRTYLDGERDLDRYFRWLMLTLAAVTVLVLSNDLLVIAGAWTATSLPLHQLLTFYADRRAAIVAAHKKFLVSRLADLSLAIAVGLLYANVGSFDLDRIAAWVDLQPRLPASMEVGACLVVAAVALRSAQLPFHGWITQVMEAPTPVSALLHAGVVNIGGFVAIRMAPWLAHSEIARLLLITVGLVTAVVAAIVTTTRVSVKVALAWSTCAQMGFMLVQCGLGLWSLALLHIVAHSLYKAYSFLNAGSAVDDWKTSALVRESRSRSAAELVATTVAAFVVAGLGLVALRAATGVAVWEGPAPLVTTLVLGLSLLPLMSARASSGAMGAALGVARVAAVVLLYGLWHVLAERMMPARYAVSTAVGGWMSVVGFVGLFALKTALRRDPNGALAHRLHPWLFSGLYLDDVVTQWAFRWWPPRLDRPSESSPQVFRALRDAEVQS